MPDPLRVAYTLEQCWHPVPGGTAVATLEVERGLRARGDIDVVGVAGRHRRPPDPSFRPAVAPRSLPWARPWLYETWNRFEQPRVERVTGPIDVVHSTIAIPAATGSPHVVTVHDVAFVHTPERFTRHGARVMRRGLERCRGCDLVLCPSASTAGDLEALGFDRARIRIVPWGVSIAAVTTDDIVRLRRTYELPERFVLFVGTVEPRKNLVRLGAAMRGVDLPLVVAGAAGWGEAVDLDGVDARFLGFVRHADLPALYSAATVFAYPSLQEGFGLPVAEAMAHGVPVVTSRGTSTEEVAGGAAVLVDPADEQSIADGIERALTDPTAWAEAGRRRAAELTWDRAVEATVAAYREVVR